MKRSSGISNGKIAANIKKNNISLFSTKRVSFIKNKKVKQKTEKSTAPMEIEIMKKNITMLMKKHP
jgi:hypothetical protein